MQGYLCVHFELNMGIPLNVYLLSILLIVTLLSSMYLITN
jgi:hypothetical protein